LFQVWKADASKECAVPDLIRDLNVAGLRPRLKAGAALRLPRTHDREPVLWLSCEPGSRRHNASCFEPENRRSCLPDPGSRCVWPGWRSWSSAGI